VQLGVLRHARLDEHLGVTRVDASRQPVDDHIPHMWTDGLRLVVVGGECVPVRDEEEALVLVLQAHPVLQHAVVMAKVQAPGGPHSGQNPLMLAGNDAHYPPPAGPIKRLTRKNISGGKPVISRIRPITPETIGFSTDASRPDISNTTITISP